MQAGILAIDNLKMLVDNKDLIIIETYRLIKRGG